MEPEDLPRPGELEKEEEEAAVAAAKVEEEAANLDDVVVVEVMEEEAGRELNSDSHYEHQHVERTDDEEDEEAKAWLQAHPGKILPPPSPSRHRYSEGERTSLEKIVPLTCHVWQQLLYQSNGRTQISDTNVETAAQQGSGDDQESECWYYLSQEVDSSQTLVTSETRFNVRTEDTEVTDFPSLEEGILTQSENQVKELNRDLFCSPLPVIQDSFASPDLPLLTCLTQDQEFTPDSLFHQSELSFAPLREIADKPEDTEWFSRPSEVSEALFQATAEVASDLASSCFSVSQHPLIGSTAVGSQCPFLPSEQGNNEETILSIDELKIPKDCDSYDTLCLYMSWERQKDTQQPETNLADKDQVSVATSSDITDENIATKRSDHFDTACSYGQYWKQKALPRQTETYLTKGLQGKAESDVITLDGDAECCSLNENIVFSERVAELQRKVHDQCDLAGQYIELAALENFHDDLEMNDSSLHRQPTLQLPSEKESNIEKPPTRESEYHSSDLRMLRMSPDTVSKTPKHLAGDTSKGSIAKVTQSNLKSGITTTPVDSDIGSHLSSSLEDLSQLAVSSPLETTTCQHTDTLNQKTLADTHLTEETLKVTAVPEPADQKTVTPTVLSSSYSHRGKPSIFYQQGLPDSHLTEEALKVSATPGPADPMTGIPTVTSTHREKPGVFDQRELPESNLTEEPLKVSATPSPVEQKTGIATVSSTSHSRGENPLFFCQQTLTDGHLTDQASKVSAVSGPADQKTGTATVLSTPYSYREKPGIFYQPQLPDSHQAEETLKDPATPGPADQKTEISAVQSSSYSQREKPSILYTQVLADSHLPEEGLEVSAVSGPADQKTGLPTVPSSAYSHRQKLLIFYQQALLDSRLPKEALKISAVSGPADEETGASTVTSTSSISSSLAEKPGAFYQQTLPNSHLTEEALNVSIVPGPDDQKTGLPSTPSSFYSQRQTPIIFAQQILPDILFPEEAPKVSAVSVLAAQKTGTPTVSSNSPSHREKSSIFYQQELPNSDLHRESLKMSAIPGLTDQKTGIPTVPSGFFSLGEKPSIFSQQELPDSHPTEKALKVSTVPGLADQKTKIPAVQSSSYSQREKPSVLYPQVLRDSHLPEEGLKVSAVPGPADQTTDTPAVPSVFHSQREKPGIFYQQTLPDSHLPKEALNIFVAPRPADLKTGTPTPTSTYYSQHREKPSILHQQALPDTHIPEEARNVSAVTGPGDQKTWIPRVLSAFYSQTEKPGIFYQQTLPGGHIAEEAQKVSAVPGPADQTGTPTPTSPSYSHTEKPGIFYQQVLPGSHPTDEALKISVAPEPVDQTTGTPTVTSPSYLQHREEPRIFYQQLLPSSLPTEEAKNVSVVPGQADQKIRIPTLPSPFYSHTEKPGVFYRQVLPHSHLPEEVLKVSVAPGPVDQMTGTPIVTSPSNSFGEKPIVIYKQAFPDGHPPEESLKVSVAPGPVDQTTGTATVTSPFYSQRRVKPSSFYQPPLLVSQIPEEALRVSSASEPADPTTGIPTITSPSYSFGEKPIIIYKQAFPDGPIPEEALKVSVVSGLTEQKTDIPRGPLVSSALEEKPITFYQQTLPDSPLNQEAVKVSATPGPADQKTETPPVYSITDSHRGKPVIFYEQTLSDSHLSEEALKVPPVPRADAQKTGTPSVSSSLYSHREKPIVFYQQALRDSQLTKEALKVSVVPRPADQTGLSTVTSSYYSHTEKPNISYQELPDSHLTEKALKVSDVPGSADQKTGVSAVTSTSYSHREKPIISYQQELPHFTEAALGMLRVSEAADQKTGINILSSNSYPQREQSVISYQQELPDLTEVTLKAVEVPGLADQKTGIQILSSSSYSNGEKSSVLHQQELPDVTEEALNVFVLPGQGDQKTDIPTVSSSYYSYGEKPSVSSQYELPDSHLTEEALKVSRVSIPAEQRTGIPIRLSSSCSHSHTEKLKIPTADVPDDQKTEFPATALSSYPQIEKSKISTVIGPDDQKTPSLTVFHSSYSQRVKPDVLFQQQLPDKDESKGGLKISAVPEPTDVNTGKPIHLSSSYFHREKSSIFSPWELPGRYVTEDVLKVSAIPGAAGQKTVLPTSPFSSFSHQEKPDIFYHKDLPDRHLTEDALKISSALGQADPITRLQTVPSGTYSHGEKHKLISEHVQRLIDNLDSSGSSFSSNNVLLNSQADDRVVINKPESAGFRDVGSEEIQDAENRSKTLKEIRTLLMEAENIALKRCNFPAPLPPFRDISDISFIQSKKVVCFKEPSSTDLSNVELLRRQAFTEESPSSRCIQKDIGTQTNLKCQRGIENWEFLSSTTVRSPLQEAENKASMALEETLRQYQAANSVMRSEPEGCSGTIGNKMIIPVMTIIKSDSSSDASDGNGSCSWDSNLPESLESVSDVLLNFFPYVSPKTSITDSREEEGVSESEDGGSSSVDSLAAHVKNLLQCESSLNHAKEILRNTEEEESRVRAHAWNLKFNLAHGCGYSISPLNEDDRRKVEEIKAELFGRGRTTDLSKGLQSPRGIGCKPEAVCSHIITQSHEKGCFRTLTSEQAQLDSHPCVFRSAEPSEMTRGWQSPSSCRARHVSLPASLDQNDSHFKVWNSLQLKSHSPFQNFIPDEFKISKGLRMPFHEKMDPWLSELVEPAFVPPKEVDFHSSSQMPSPEPMKNVTTSITFSSHRHSKGISDSSVVKVGVTEGSQCTGASVGIFNSHFTEDQNPPRELKQKTSCPSSFKMQSNSPDKEVTILAEGRRQSQKLSVDFEHSLQEEKPLERSDFTGSHCEPSTTADSGNVKEIQISDNHTLISRGRPSSTLGVSRSSSRLGVKEKNVTITPDLPSCIFLEQRELFEQSKAPHADHHVRKHHSPSPQHQDYVAPDLPSCIFLEQRELFEQCRVPHVDHQMREKHSPLPQGQDSVASDLPSPISLERCQSKAPGVDDQMRKHHFPLPQGQDCVVEKNNQQKPKSHISTINVEAKFNNVVSQSPPNRCTLTTSASTPPSNRKALSCVCVTFCPKTSSKLDSGTLDKRFYSLDAASKARINSEFNFDLPTISSRSLEPTSKLLTSKPVAQDQEALGFLGPKSSLDFQVVQPSLPDSNTITQDLKTIPSQNSQIVTSRQIQVNISDFEGHSNPEGTPVSADRLPEKKKTPLSAFSEKLSSDAVTQITTESPEKTLFSSEILINPEDCGHEITEPSNQKLRKASVKFASSSSVQQVTFSCGTDGQPLLLPYKPSGSTKMYYVPQLRQIPPSSDSKSDTTVESSHSGSNDAVAPDFPAQVLGTRDDDVSATVNIRHKEGIYSKRVVTKASLPVGGKPLRSDNADASVQVLITGDENLSDKKPKESHSTSAVTEAAQAKEKEPLQKDTAESECHSEFENTTHFVFRSAKFYIHHPIHLPSDQDMCHESLGRSVFMRHSWEDFFQHHPDKHREHICLPLPYQNMDKTKTDYTKVKSLSINVNLGNKEVMHTTESQATDYPKYNVHINDPKRDQKLTPEQTTQHTVSLNELWNKYRERQRQQRQPKLGDRKELSLVEPLDRLAKLLQNPITHSLQVSESTHDDGRGERGVKEWSGRQQQRNKLQKKKRFQSLEKSHKNTGELKKSKVFSRHGAGRSNQIKIEQIKFDKYILSKQPGFNYISNTSSDCRPSEESELLTDTTTNILSSTTSTVESDILTQTDREVALHERSSSVSTIDTARLIQAFGHERVCLSPRRIKLYSSMTNQQRRYLEKRSKHSKKVLNTCHPEMTSEHTRRRRIKVANHVISSDAISSSVNSFLSSNSTLCNKQNVHVLNKGIQAGNLEIVNGAKKHTRDVGMTFPTPSSSAAKLEEDSDVTSWSEEKHEKKMLFTTYPVDRKLKRNKNSHEGVSWFVPVENVESGSKKENMPKMCGPGVSWFEPLTKTKPWREPLWEQNRQGQHLDGRGSLAGPGREDGRDTLKPFVRATLQESLQLHRPDFISRSGERIKRLKLIVQERKLQSMLQSERDALFNIDREQQSHQNCMHPLPKRVFLAAQKNKPISKKEMIQRSKR
ncbi:centrosome-associated protein ALMS1-like isoform X5 [Aotus nancymaae]